MDKGGNFIDTADMYSEWGSGNVGGESETILGNWLKKRGGRDSVVIATKVAKLSTRRGLSATNLQAACEDSLSRLQTDYIDLYYAMKMILKLPEETLGAFDSINRARCAILRLQLYSRTIPGIFGGLPKKWLCCLCGCSGSVQPAGT